MPHEIVSPEEFLTRLERCFAEPSQSSSTSIWLTHKRYSYEADPEDASTSPAEGESSEYDILIRCIHGKTPKFSTKIPSSSLQTFHQHYGALLKASMAPKMRKRDKKKEKLKAENVAKKRRELAVDVVIGNEGKRGAGRRQRMRKIAAQKKKEAERERLELAAAAREQKGADS